MLRSYWGEVISHAGGGFAGSIIPRSAMLDVEFSQLSDPGRVREHNEDYLGHAVPITPEQIRSHGWLFALADGVGGQEQGEVASHTAVETILAGFRQATPGEPPANLLQHLVKAANTKVYETGHAASSGGAAMATTIVTCLLRYDRVAVAHVGDSRCYLIRRGQANVLTRDHTLAGEQVRLGLLSSSEAGESESRHILSRSLGNDLFVNVDIDEHQVLAGDMLLLCSDGLYGSISPHEMAAVVGRSSNIKDATYNLVALAKEKDGSDNISVQLIHVRNVERVGMYRGRPYKLR
jgi:serine/threonine protein phosphatase PrpC